MLVPTVDTIRNAFVTRTLVMNKCHTLLVGDTGTGKTVLAQVGNLLLSPTGIFPVHLQVGGVRIRERVRWW